MRTTTNHHQHHLARAILSIVVAIVMVISLIPSSMNAYADAPQNDTAANAQQTGSSAANAQQAGSSAANGGSTAGAGANSNAGNAGSSANTTGAGSGAAANGASATNGNGANGVSAGDATNATAPDANGAQQASDQATGNTNAAAETQPATPIVQIGDTTYTTIADAAKAAKPGDTITLLTDVNLTKTGTLTITGMTLDLNGHTVSADNFSLIFQGDNATIKNGDFVGTNGAAYGLFYGDSMTSHNVLIENVNITGGINIFNSNGVTLRNVNADAAANHSPYYALWCDVNAQVTVESGNFTSTGAAVIGLTDKSPQKPTDTLDIKGGNFYTTSSPLVLPGNRYEPTISGGTYFSADAQNYLAPGYCVVAEDDGRYAVEQESTTVQPDDDKTTLPDDLELVAIDTTPAQTHVILEDANDPAIKAELDKAGGTQHLWMANVILRNKTTLEPNHDTETSFVIAYPAGIDATNYQDYTFVVLHLKPVKDDGVVTSEPVIVPAEDVVAEEDGLHITSTLSPFAISYGLTATPDQPSTPGQGTTTPSEPSTPTTPSTPDEPAVVPGGNTGAGDAGGNTGAGAGSNTSTNGSAIVMTNGGANAAAGTNSGALQGAVAGDSSAATSADAAAQADEATSADAGLTPVTYSRVHIGHQSAAFLANPFWYFETLNEIWVALLGAGLLAILAVVIGTVTLVRRSKKNSTDVR